MQVLKMAMHATVEMLITSLSQPTLKSVTSHALAILVSSVAARGACKYMISNIQKVQRHALNRKQLRHQQQPWHQEIPHQQPMPF